MTKRVFIVHCWDGTPEDNWYPWLKAELEKRGFEVHVPEMPDTETPTIDAWVPFLKQQVGTVDENTFFIGHSVGCQTILRYLQTENKVGGILFVAGWFNLIPEVIKEEGAEEIAKPWIETPIDTEKLKENQITIIFSDNDPYVPQSDAKLFEEKLNAKVVMQHDQGHFTADDGCTELPVALEEFLKLAE